MEWPVARVSAAKPRLLSEKRGGAPMFTSFVP